MLLVAVSGGGVLGGEGQVTEVAVEGGGNSRLHLYDILNGEEHTTTANYSQISNTY